MRIISTILFVILLSLPVTSLASENPEIARAQFCTSIVDRDPGDAPESVNVGLNTLYFFTEIVNGKDSSLSHRWFYNDVQIADVVLKVGADHWRTWSTKQVWHLTPGIIKVQVIGADNQVLVEKEISIQ